MSTTSKPDYERIATELLFSGRTSMTDRGVAFRKGKSLADVQDAVRKARDPKNGRAKTEFEINMLAGYLERIFKPAPAIAVAIAATAVANGADQPAAQPPKASA